jgi:hypothetical protein
LVGVCALAFGCERSGQPTEDQTKPVESSARDQAVEPSGPDPSGAEASAPADEPQAAAIGQEMKVEVTEGEQSPRTVEVGCAKCMFAMKGVDSHELAIMIGGKGYLVTGAYVDPTESGLCKTIKKAEVAGRLVKYGEGVTIDEREGEFIAVSIELEE